MQCIIKNSVEYRDLKKVSTLSENKLDIFCSQFQEEHGRLPKSDEIPGSNSTSYLKTELGVKNDIVETKKLLDFTNKETVEEAVHDINRKYLDLQTEVLDLGETSLIKIKQKPTNTYKEVNKVYEPDDLMSSNFIVQGLNSLRELYGYNFITITTDELESDEWSQLMPSNKLVKAFIYNGNIYVNLDNATLDSKVHEMLHLLVGSLRYSDPTLYQSLLEKTLLIENIDSLLNEYSDKTRNNALEEVFVSETAKLLVGMKSKLSSLDKELIYEIQRTIKRTLDTMLNGDYSTNIISNGRLITMNLKEVAKEVNSRRTSNEFKGFSNFEGSELNRRLANMKSELLRKGDLIEVCE